MNVIGCPLVTSAANKRSTYQNTIKPLMVINYVDNKLYISIWQEFLWHCKKQEVFPTLKAFGDWTDHMFIDIVLTR